MNVGDGKDGAHLVHLDTLPLIHICGQKYEVKNIWSGLNLMLITNENLQNVDKSAGHTYDVVKCKKCILFIKCDNLK